MQLQNELLPSSAPRLGVMEMAAQVYRNEGINSFYTGLPAAVLRQSTYGGLCFSVYPYLRDGLSAQEKSSDAPFWARLAAGAIAGGGAAALANPTDVVKVRLQADGRLQMLQGTPPRYSGTMAAFGAIMRKEGLAAFWRGTLPNVQRAIVVNGAGIAAYDQSKQVAVTLMGEGDSLAARFVAALAGGVVTSLVGCPFDTLKTRMMNQASGSTAYSSTWGCLTATVRVEGIFALWKGLLPVYCRQAYVASQGQYQKWPCRQRHYTDSPMFESHAENRPFNMLNYMIMETLTSKVLGKSKY